MNQTYTVTPAAAAAVEIATNANRQFTATVPSGTVVSIRLFAAADVTDTDGTFTFADANSDNLADETASTATITVVNGVSQTPAQQINDITSGGTITFTVTSATAADFIPVVWADPTAANGGDNRLGLTAPATSNANAKTPSETFGVGGRTAFVPTEATLGSTTPTVSAVNTALDYFTSATATYYYDANDVFKKGGALISLAEFEGILTATDILAVGYHPEPSGVSTFDVTTDNGPADPTGVSATAGNHDNGTTNNDVRVAYTKSTTVGATQTIKRITFTGAETCVNTTGTELATGHTSGTFDDLNVANGTYKYCVKAVQGTGAVTSSSNWVISGSVTTPGAADTTAPTAQYKAVTTDSGFQNIADTGDVIRVIFDEAVTLGAAPRLRIVEQNANPETFDLSATNATFSLNAAAVVIGGTSYAAGRIATLTLTAKPTPIATVTGGDGELRYDGTAPRFSNASDIKDAANNAYAPTGVVGDAISRHITAPDMNASPVSGVGIVTITYSQPVRCNNDAATQAQYSFAITGGTDTGNTRVPTGVTCNGTTTVVLTIATVAADSTGNLTYTQSATTTARVEGLNSRTATSPETEAV